MTARRALSRWLLLSVAVAGALSSQLDDRMTAIGGPAALAAQGAAPAPPGALTVISRDGRRSLATIVVNNQPLVALDELAALFQLGVREDPLTGALTITAQGRTMALATTEGLASVGGRLIALPTPPVRQGRRWLVPIEFIGRALPLIYDRRVELRRTSSLVLVGEVVVPRVSVRPDVTGRVVVEIAPPVPYTVTQETGRLVVRLEADALDVASPPRLPVELVSGVHLGETPTTLVVELTPRVASVQTVTERGGDALVLAFSLQPTPAAEPMPAPPPEAAPREPVPTATLRTIVIDPGHGGAEEGAHGPGGTVEKQVTLAVARRLKTLIENRLGLRVLLTRSGDETVDLDARAAFANNNKADLFLSLHANASLRPSVRGAQVFYVSRDEYGEEARRLAASEGESLPVAGGGSRAIDLILWELAQIRHLHESAALAGLLEAALRDRVVMSPRAIEQAPFRVLVGANMPAVLVEMGFITNPDDERRLASEEGQTVLAMALLDGLVRYRARQASGSTPLPPGASR